MRLLVLSWLFVQSFFVQAQEKSCYLPEMKGVYIGMTYGEFFDLMEVGLMEASLTKRDSTLILDHFITHRGDLNQWSYTFYLPDWTLDGQIPSDAVLRSVEAIYANDYDVKNYLVALFGEHYATFVADKKVLFKYDARWSCREADGDVITISLLHKRVYFEQE